MATSRVPFGSVGQVNKQPVAEKELGKESGKESGKEKEARSDLEKVRGGLEDSVEQLDRRELLQQLKLHKMILKGCFEENDMLRERIANVEAQFSALQDEIDQRDGVILELTALLENLQKQQQLQ